MALEIALAVLGPAIDVAKWVSKPIIRQFNYLCCFTTNISGLEEEAKKLDDALAGLEREVEIKRRNIEDPVPQVETWIAESKVMKGEISGILNEASNVGSGCCSKLGARFSLSRRAKKTTESTKEHRDGKPPAQFLPRPNADTQGGNTFECDSRNEIEEDIMTALRATKIMNRELKKDEEKVKMIGICGMGGLGKTTMANKIMNRALKENIFREAVIVTLSEKVDISKIQEDIGAKLGLDKLKVETSLAVRAELLLSRLSDTTILLVLDDVWETLELQDFGIPCDSKGCTILFTSRNRDDLRKMGVKIFFGMKELSEVEAWSFFKERAGTCVDDRKLNPTAKQVAKECGGLPINLAAVAAGLYDERDAGIWKDTLRKLEESVPANVQYKKPLRWSYDRLNSEEAQFLFLLCCLFPEDADIPLKSLTYFFMGLGRMSKGIRNMEAARNNMRALTKFLKDRSLLLESDWEDCVRMHDVVRDVSISIAKERGYIGKDGCTWISSSHLVGERNELLNGSRCPNLDLLFLDSGYDDDSLGFKFDNAFVEGMSELNVLCIKNYRSLTTLPHPTQSLGNLKALILVSCLQLETISVVGELVNLEILICRHCGSIEKLPSEMMGLNRLKVLDLTYCRKLQSIGRGIIASLVGLEELTIQGSFSNWEAEEREERGNASIKELEALPNLACLEIEIKDGCLHLFCQPQKISFSSLDVLDIHHHNPLCAHEIPSSAFNRLEKLTIITCEGSMSLFTLSVAENLVSLRELCITYCGEMIKVIEDEQQQQQRILLFPKLEVLELTYLPKLVSFCEWKCEVELPSLTKVEIRECRNMEHFSMGFVSAPNLIIVKIDKEEFDASKDLNGLLQQHHLADPKKLLFGNRILEIPSLLFNRLEELAICEYKGSVSFFSPSAIGNLVNLKTLAIARCDEIVKVIEDVEEKEDAKLVSGGEIRTLVFPKLEQLYLIDLPKLVRFCEWKCDVELPSLRRVEIMECPNMEKFSLGLVATPNLEIIEIDEEEIDDTNDLNVAVQQHYLARLEKGE